ncbi:MAG: pantetheine-phosphate adenylyltransferase [Anaerobiospirillum sp.]|nr:pantetheine-phosphate adenylyltransferase [Anaerobiospirillum sp.]
MNIAVFPGTFDPATLGHFDIIQRSSKLFDRLIVGVAFSPTKKPLFSLEERVELMKSCCKTLSNVEVIGFTGLIADFIKAHEANILIRGIRTVADYDYEMQLTGMYRVAVPQLEVVMLPTNGNLAFISSSFVRELIVHGGDISHFVPHNVAKAIMGKMKDTPQVQFSEIR